MKLDGLKHDFFLPYPRRKPTFVSRGGTWWHWRRWHKYIP